MTLLITLLVILIGASVLLGIIQNYIFSLENKKKINILNLKRSLNNLTNLIDLSEKIPIKNSTLVILYRKKITFIETLLIYFKDKEKLENQIINIEKKTKELIKNNTVFNYRALEKTTSQEVFLKNLSTLKKVNQIIRSEYVARNIKKNTFEQESKELLTIIATIEMNWNINYLYENLNKKKKTFKIKLLNDIKTKLKNEAFTKEYLDEKSLELKKIEQRINETQEDDSFIKNATEKHDDEIEQLFHEKRKW